MGFYANPIGKVGAMLTTTYFYIITEPVSSGSPYTLEKIALPTFATGEVITNIHWNTETGKPIAIETNKSVYFFRSS